MFPQIYPLTDIALSGLSHAEQVERLCDGGATLIQLREKNLPTLEFYRQAKAALTVARQRGARVIVNDRVDIALALGADGVHLGQDDLPPEAARRLLGEPAIIGFSTHNADQARQAIKLPVNYLAIGPIFRTRTKANPSPEVGLDGLRAVRQIVGSLALVAIGGITEFNAQEVIEAGADAVALVSALLTDPHQIAERTRLLSRFLSS
jgi:thiamine-phosphate pyrophosphorylase